MSLRNTLNIRLNLTDEVSSLVSEGATSSSTIVEPPKVIQRYRRINARPISSPATTFSFTTSDRAEDAGERLTNFSSSSSSGHQSSLFAGKKRTNSEVAPDEDREFKKRELQLSRNKLLEMARVDGDEDSFEKELNQINAQIEELGCGMTRTP